MPSPSHCPSGVGSESRLRLPAVVLSALWDGVPALAERNISAVVAEVPLYAKASGPQRRQIEEAIRQTITVGVGLITGGVDPDASAAHPALDWAYSLGRAEARAGRSPEVLLAAYRVGARTVWREWSNLAVAHRLSGDQLAVFGELIFAYMDRLSVAAASGHGDESAKTGSARQRARELLVRRLLGSASSDQLLASADRADWLPPRTLTAVAVPSERAVDAAQVVDQRTLGVPEDVVVSLRQPMSLLLVPDIDGAARDRFIASWSVAGTVVGPARPWMRAGASVRRAERLLAMKIATGTVTDTERHLPELVLGANPEALLDLRDRALAPLRDLRPHVRRNLTATLRAWIFHQGRRNDIAAELFVHPQTVRYRLSQLRELYGDRLTEPRTILELTVALGLQRLPDKGDRESNLGDWLTT